MTALAPYIPVHERLPAPLEDVIGLAVDDAGPYRALAFLDQSGRWLYSQCETHLEIDVIAWAPLPEIPDHLLTMREAA
jgi:hypothetical protein